MAEPQCTQSGPPSRCVQVIEPGIDFMAHVLLQHLDDSCMVIGIKEVAVDILQPERPLVVIVTRDRCEKDDVLANLAVCCMALGVPVVYALSRFHMGKACGTRRGISAVSIRKVNGPRGAMLLSAVFERAAKACVQWSLCTSEKNV